ncbi:unnamed protein product [Kluyveromyces dobzhanskii CBS 2104]|uniref:WGS project CCBQ000000000 data, contig 00058 n=1 Tax=Kluyveromyces dobzhanskii CBS 2104 TaxID=1427455 RepID=A0A0A8LDF3_9SACH|nr:unnamed protein product [Kluyveromyces dobzhanskii CBS 2104]
MTLKTIYIARHGYRSNWLPTPPAHPAPPTGVNSDVPLAAHGVDQAKELAHYLISIDNQPQMIVSSPLYRCLQTSEPAADLLELPIYIDRGLSEWYKPDRDIIPEPATYDILNNFFAGKLKREWPNSVVPSLKGETEEDIFQRCKTFWPIFVQELEERFPEVETVLLVTHAATKIALGMTLLKFDNVRESLDEDGTVIRSGSCSLDKYEILEDDLGEDENGEETVLPFDQRQWKLTMNGNTEFLSAGEEMHWDFKSGFEAGSDDDIKARRKKQLEQQGVETNGDKKDGIDDKDEYEHVYVSLDVHNRNYRERHTVPNQTTLQHSGLETDKPLIKIADNVYEGTWKKSLGTELAFANETTNSKSKEGEQDAANTERVYRVTDSIDLNPIQPM